MKDTTLKRMKHRPTYYSHFFAGWYYLYRKVEYHDSNGRKRSKKVSFIDPSTGNVVASRSILPIEQAAAELNKAAIQHFSQRARESKKITKLREYYDGQLPYYTSIGGYPLFYVDKENSALCPTCANELNDSSQFAIVDYDINYEDSNLYCDQCSKQIQSAYGDDDDDAE